MPHVVDNPAPTAPRLSRRLSPLRILAALIIIGATVLLGMSAYDRLSATPPALAEPWFAPYVDVTLTPRFPFEDPGQNPSDEVVLAFVVAHPGDGCTPSWGAHYTLDEAFETIDLDRRIERLRRWGGNVVISFGGERNQELALTCLDGEALAAAYTTVIDRYQVATIDFDIEGAALADMAAAARRAAATKAIQDSRRGEGSELAVWLTLPVAPYGMTAEGVASIDSMLAAEVDLAGVNLMVMNFGESRGDTDMAEAVIAALDAAEIQVRNAYRRAGIDLTDEQLHRKIGVTPMIGQNDSPSDVFDLEAAALLLEVVGERALGRVSFWSLDRDHPCGPNVDPRSVSNYCSGIQQAPYAFSEIYEVIEGSSSTAAGWVTVTVPLQEVVDDPAASPYPIWDEERAYPEDDKVVWRGNVYLAKWWTLGDLPDEPVVNEWETPWRLLGPVLPTDQPITTTTLAYGTYPEWNGTSTYLEGERVQWRGVAYEAKWWNSGEQPGIDVPNEWDTPWRRLDGSEVAEGG